MEKVSFVRVRDDQKLFEFLQSVANKVMEKQWQYVTKKDRYVKDAAILWLARYDVLNAWGCVKYFKF